jgi:hypothetical protein
MLNEHCGFLLKDVDYYKGIVILEKNDGTERVLISFEFIQDLCEYTKGEGSAHWDWKKIHPKQSL